MSEGTKTDPWRLMTPPGSSEYVMWREEDADPPALVCQVGSTTLRYHLRAIDDEGEMPELVRPDSANRTRPVKRAIAE